VKKTLPVVSGVFPSPGRLRLGRVRRTFGFQPHLWGFGWPWPLGVGWSLLRKPAEAGL